jgi:hypothetical protein
MCYDLQKVEFVPTAARAARVSNGLADEQITRNYLPSIHKYKSVNFQVKAWRAYPCPTREPFFCEPLA